jgi:hypothetical protein
VTITNNGTANLVISGVTIVGADAASFSHDGGGITLIPGGSTTINVSFTASLPAGAKSATLRVASDDIDTPDLDITLGGTATTPDISGSVGSIAFGSVATGMTSAAQSVTITNNGTADLVISAVTLTGTDPGDFAHDGAGITLVPTGSTTINVTFTPSLPTGAKSATLQISSDDIDTPNLDITLTGTGT